MFGTSKEKTGASFTHANEGPTECSVALTEKLDLLFEKRHTIREAALKTINSTLSTRVCCGCIEDRQERLAEALQYILHRNDEQECLLALKCISLSAITLQEGKDFYKQIENTITKIITDGSLALTSSVRAAAITALATINLLNSVDPDHTLEVAYTLSGIFYEDAVAEREEGEGTGGGAGGIAMVYRAAIDAWALLLTTVEDKAIMESLFPENIARLNELLDHSDFDVRVSAGKALVVITEALRNETRTSQELPDYESVDLNSIDTLVPWEELTEKLEGLSQEKFKAQSKVEGKKQKRLFREIVSSIMDGQSPSESLMVRDVRVELNTWAQITQLDRLRDILGEGFMQHMTQNSNMMSMFDYSVSIDATPSAPQFTKKERRRSMIEAEKEYTRYMEASRRTRARDLAGFASE